MDHELLHNDRGGYDLRLTNKVKKDKDKTDPGDRKKWNFRKTSASEASSNDGPSPTFGLINQSSEAKSKPTMIFENALSDHDEPNDLQVKSPPTSLNISQTASQQTRTSPKVPSVDQQQGPKVARARQRSLPSRTSPPAMIIRPQSARKPTDRVCRHMSVPPRQMSATLLQQQPLQSPSSIQERPDFTKANNDLQAANQWQPVQQTYFTPENLSNVNESRQDNQSHKARSLSDKDTVGIEVVDDNRNTMWQGNQDMSHGNWTDFLSPSNEVFVPDDRAWAGTDNVVADDEETGDTAPGNLSHSSRSSNSSESDAEETEESVWKINEEQKAYYLNQFRILQPAEKGVVAGQKARDFFLKSGLGTDVLSKIWNLADLDSDGALDFEEFCIAMHIVVAVRHGLEVPPTLPQYLIPEKYEIQAANVAPPLGDTNSNELSVTDSSQSWARFSPDPRTQTSETDERTVQPVGSTVQTGGQHAQPVAQHAGQHAQQISQHAQQTNQHAHQTSQHAQQPSQHAQQPSQHAPQLRQHQQTVGEITQHNQQVGQHTQSIVQHEQPVAQPSQQVQQPAATQSVAQSSRPLERTMSDPSSADVNSTKDNSTHTPRKISLGIPRVRGQPKQTNLLDTPHWAILPPPSKFSKDNPEETGKGNQFVPTGTIIPADPEDHSRQVKPEKPDQVSSRDSDSSSSETEQTMVKERPKSLSHEVDDSPSSLSKNSSDNSLRVSQDSVDGEKKLPVPVPPPRRRSGHSRSSSLDLQKLFNKGGTTASLQNVTDYQNEPTRETQENFANFDDFNKFENTSASHSNENIARFGHRRSASLDSTHAVYVEPSPQPAIVEDTEAKDSSSNRLEVSAKLPRPVPKKKPASPPPPILGKQKKEIQQDSGSDSMMEKEKKLSKEPIHFVVKPLTRLEQLHAKIRDLKTKNTRLSRINNELQQELKEMMEKRVGLESSLEQLKPFAK